jgi:integrase/recombinase XerD
MAITLLVTLLITGTSLKRHSMINRVTCRIVARANCSDGRVSINAQCFVNKQRIVIPLSIYIESKYFDASRELVKNSLAESTAYNSIINNARSRVAEILEQANTQNLRLEAKSFRAKFIETLDDVDLVSFWRKDLADKQGTVEKSTIKTQRNSLAKFQRFKKVVPLSQINLGLIQDYERHLKRIGNNINTRHTALKILKAVINRLNASGYEIKNPFQHFKLISGEGRIVFLEIEEQKKLIKIYDEKLLNESLLESLLVFLVQAFTSFRISDAKLVNPKWIDGTQLEFVPYKTRKNQKSVTFGLSKVAMRFLEDLFALRRNKKLKSEQKINDDLKLIAAFCGIKKHISSHVARHTFATTFLTIGGRVEVLQKIMGHSRIETTMRYVHIIDKCKTEQMGNFDNEFK